MSIIQYTRQQLLAIFDPSLPLPDDTVRISKIVFDNPTVPVSLQKTKTVKYRSSNPDQKRVHSDIDIKKVMKIKSQSSAPKKAAAAPSVTQMSWFYLDPTGKRQGPFQSTQLREWWLRNSFPRDLKISPDGKEFDVVESFFGDLSAAFSYNPLLFPFLGCVSADADDQLQKLYLDLENSFVQQ